MLEPGVRPYVVRFGPLKLRLPADQDEEVSGRPSEAGDEDAKDDGDLVGVLSH
jgi:hypothetical protein